MGRANEALLLTAVPLRSEASGELDRSEKLFLTPVTYLVTLLQYDSKA